jgi:hypothetical protein
MKIASRFALAALCRLLLVAGPAFAESWTQTTAPIGYWTCVASSADGTRLVAASRGPIHLSPDAGATWTLSGPASVLLSVASSATGNTLAAVAQGFAANVPVYTSSDFGATWSFTNTWDTYWNFIASSADGTKMVGAADGTSYQYGNGTILTSTNSGGTWLRTDAPGGFWSLVTASADARHLLAVGRCAVYTSTDFGDHWTSNSAPVTNWSSVACSADGGKSVAVVNGGGIYVAQSTPTPVLNIDTSPGGVGLSWIIPSLDFKLQQTSDPTTANWTDVPARRTLNFTNLRYEMTLPLAGSNRFYGLSASASDIGRPRN